MSSPRPVGPISSSGCSRPCRSYVLSSPGRPEHVVGVEVREEDRVELGQPERRSQELALRALAAVDEQHIALAPEHGRGRCARGRWRRAAGAEEDDLDLHQGSVDDRPRARGSYARVRRHQVSLARGCRANPCCPPPSSTNSAGPELGLAIERLGLSHDLPGALEELGQRHELATFGCECEMPAAHGSTSTSPGWIVASSSALRSMIELICGRGSPP